MSKNFNVWLLVFLLQSTVFLIAGYFGFFKFLLLHDFTFIGFASLAIWLFLSLSIGYKTYGSKDIDEWQWYLSDKLMALGLLGTVVGLSYVFGSFDTLDMANMENAKVAIKNVASGMSVAFLATICGIVTSYTSKLQLVLANQKFTPKNDDKELLIG